MKYCLLPFMLLLTSCIHKPEYAIVHQSIPTCDSIGATYYKDIKPIFSVNCYQCHASAVTIDGGLDLEDTASLKRYLKYNFKNDGIYGSRLYHCLMHSQGAQQMPPTYILDSCSLHKIHYWISMGALIN